MWASRRADHASISITRNTVNQFGNTGRATCSPTASPVAAPPRHSGPPLAGCKGIPPPRSATLPPAATPPRQQPSPLSTPLRNSRLDRLPESSPERIPAVKGHIAAGPRCCGHTRPTTTPRLISCSTSAAGNPQRSKPPSAWTTWARLVGPEGWLKQPGSRQLISKQPSGFTVYMQTPKSRWPAGVASMASALKRRQRVRRTRPCDMGNTCRSPPCRPMGTRGSDPPRQWRSSFAAGFGDVRLRTRKS